MTFSVDDRESFEDVTGWLNCLREYADLKVKKVLVGNKCDLRDRKVSEVEAEALAGRHGMKYFDASAKENYNIDAFMDHLIGEAYEEKFVEK